MYKYTLLARKVFLTSLGLEMAGSSYFSRKYLEEKKDRQLGTNSAKQPTAGQFIYTEEQTNTHLSIAVVVTKQ